MDEISFSRQQWLAASPGNWLGEATECVRADGTHGPLPLNILQKRIHAYYYSCLLAGRQCRGVLVKPRKKGASTCISGLHAWQLRRFPHRLALVGHQKEASTDTLFDMVKHFVLHDRLTLWKNELLNRDAKTELEFTHGAKTLRYTDKNPDAIRSETVQAVHATEVAYFDNGEATMTAALNALSKVGFTSAWMESTPNGMAGVFPNRFLETARWPYASECPEREEYWRQWEEDLGQLDQSGELDNDEGWVRIFAAWYEFDDAYSPLTDAERDLIRHTIDAQEWYTGEKELLDRYGRRRADGSIVLGREVGPEIDAWMQLAWRRKTIDSLCNRDRYTFMAEYPSNPRECFLGSGRPYFDRQSLNEMEARSKALRANMKHGYIQVHDHPDFMASAELIQVADVAQSVFSIAEIPTIDFRYLISVDTMRGLDQTRGDGKGEMDRHSVLVHRAPYLDEWDTAHRAMIVAMLRLPSCHVPLYQLAAWVYGLHLYYGGCLVVPEINNCGQTLIDNLRTLGCSRIYSRNTVDPKTGRKTNARPMIGWETTTHSRPLMLDRTHKLLRDGVYDCPFPDVIRELRAMIHAPNDGKPEAGNGEHDDQAMAFSIGAHLIDHATPYQARRHLRQIPEEIARHLPGGGMAYGAGMRT